MVATKGMILFLVVLILKIIVYGWDLSIQWTTVERLATILRPGSNVVLLAVPNSIDPIKFDFSTAVAQRLKPSRATAVPNSIHNL